MIKIELTNRIKNAKYIDEDEKKMLLEQLPDLKTDDLEKLNDIFIDTDNEYEILTEASDFAVAGFMQALITMNDLELKEQEKNKQKQND